jgi:hypothetical protein
MFKKFPFIALIISLLLPFMFQKAYAADSYRFEVTGRFEYEKSKLEKMYSFGLDGIIKG